MYWLIRVYKNVERNNHLDKQAEFTDKTYESKTRAEFEFNTFPYAELFECDDNDMKLLKSSLK